MQIRYFAKIDDITRARTSAVLNPLPMDLLGHLTARRSEAT
jgi:hypothetical protein